MDGILNSLSLPDTSSPPCSIPSAPPVGIIEEVHGPIIDILCRSLPPLHQALFVCIDGERYVFEVHRHLDESRAPPLRCIAPVVCAG
jgi:hypothetical protein